MSKVLSAPYPSDPRRPCEFCHSISAEHAPCCAQRYVQEAINAGTGAVGAELASLSASFRTVFANVLASANEAATAIIDLNVRLGLTGPQLEVAATQMLYLARISGQDVGPVIQSTIKTSED